MTVTLKTGEKIEIDSELFNRALSYDLTVSLVTQKKLFLKGFFPRCVDIIYFFVGR